jgi:hypothetical protein
LKKEAALEDAFADFIVVTPQTPLPKNEIKQIALESYSTLDEPLAFPTPPEQPLILPEMAVAPALPELPVQPLDLSDVKIASAEPKDTPLNLNQPPPSISPPRA